MRIVFRCVFLLLAAPLFLTGFAVGLVAATVMAGWTSVPGFVNWLERQLG